MEKIKQSQKSHSKKLLINFDEIGTSSFMDMVGEMEKQEKIAERNLELWEERKTGMESEVTILEDQIFLMLKKGNLTKAEKDLLKELNKKKKELSKSIMRNLINNINEDDINYYSGYY